MLSVVLGRSAIARGAEAAQQLHDVMIVLWRRPAAAQDPVEQIGVGAIEQSLEPVELVTVEAREGRFGERAEDEARVRGTGTVNDRSTEANDFEAAAKKMHRKNPNEVQTVQ